MNIGTLLFFSLAVLPLVCTPGPDILFVASQALSGGTGAGLRATAGVLAGYGVHSLLVALGLAAVVAASPLLFEAIRWGGITYLVFIAYKLIRAAMKPGGLSVSPSQIKDQVTKGFLTSLLNPKGMMVYIAILPQFMDHTTGSATVQAVLLSATFIFWCAVIYSAVTLAMSRLGGGGLNDGRRRLVDGVAGGMILGAAGFMAFAQH